MKYSIVTFGCRVNQADSLQLEEDLIARGGWPAPAEQADLVIVNTCSVTAAADQGARQVIRRIARQNPGARIVVTGCYATRRSDEVAALPGVVRVVANPRKDTLLDELGLTTAERFGGGDGACGAAIAPGMAGRTAYTLRVQTGCSEACSYCIIPSTRGPGISRSIPQVLSEIGRISAAGFREIALTGVHLGSYGRDRDDGSTLVGLLRAIDRQSARDALFRISSLEPMDCSEEIVDLVASSPRFAPHFHLPLQHASDRILRAMRRPYTLRQYSDLVNGIRRRLPHASIGSDIIVGFPGETEEDFAELISYLRSSPLTNLHVFPYSDRPGTEAAVLPSKAAGGDIRTRAAGVREVGHHLRAEFHKAQVGTVRRGLTIEDGSLAVTDNHLKVRIPCGRPRNEWVQVKVLAAGENILGEVVSEAPGTWSA